MTNRAQSCRHGLLRHSPGLPRLNHRPRRCGDSRGARSWRWQGHAAVTIQLRSSSHIPSHFSRPSASFVTGRRLQSHRGAFGRPRRVANPCVPATRFASEHVSSFGQGNAFWLGILAGQAEGRGRLGQPCGVVRGFRASCSRTCRCRPRGSSKRSSARSCAAASWPGASQGDSTCTPACVPAGQRDRLDRVCRYALRSPRDDVAELTRSPAASSVRPDQIDREPTAAVVSSPSGGCRMASPAGT